MVRAGTAAQAPASSIVIRAVHIAILFCCERCIEWISATPYTQHPIYDVRKQPISIFNGQSIHSIQLRQVTKIQRTDPSSATSISCHYTILSYDICQLDPHYQRNIWAPVRSILGRILPYDTTDYP
jgi:hypothetical protein